MKNYSTEEPHITFFKQLAFIRALDMSIGHSYEYWVCADLSRVSINVLFQGTANSSVVGGTQPYLTGCLLRASSFT